MLSRLLDWACHNRARCSEIALGPRRAGNDTSKSTGLAFFIWWDKPAGWHGWIEYRLAIGESCERSHAAHCSPWRFASITAVCYVSACPGPALAQQQATVVAAQQAEVQKIFEAAATKRAGEVVKL